MIRKRIYLLLTILVITLFFGNCRKGVGSKDIEFMCVDQSGKEVVGVVVKSNGEERTSNERGMCVFPLDNADLDSAIPIEAEKEGYLFLGPEKVFIEKERDPKFVLNFFRGYHISFRTLKKSGSGEEFYGGVDIDLDGANIGKTDNDGKLDFFLFDDTEGSRRIEARETSSSAQVRTIDIDQNQFEYTVEFTFIKYEPPSQSESLLSEKNEPTFARLVVVTGKYHHTVSGLLGGSDPWPKHVFDVPTSTQSVEIHVTGYKSFRVPLNLEADCSDSLVCDLVSRKYTLWRQFPGQRRYQKISARGF